MSIALNKLAACKSASNVNKYLIFKNNFKCTIIAQFANHNPMNISLTNLITLLRTPYSLTIQNGHLCQKKFYQPAKDLSTIFYQVRWELDKAYSNADFKNLSFKELDIEILLLNDLCTSIQNIFNSVFDPVNHSEWCRCLLEWGFIALDEEEVNKFLFANSIIEQKISVLKDSLRLKKIEKKLEECNLKLIENYAPQQHETILHCDFIKIVVDRQFLLRRYLHSFSTFSDDLKKNNCYLILNFKIDDLLPALYFLQTGIFDEFLLSKTSIEPLIEILHYFGTPKSITDHIRSYPIGDLSKDETIQEIQKFENQFLKNINHRLLQLYKNKLDKEYPLKYSDFTVVSNGCKFPVHISVLIGSSHYFEAMFSNPWKETKDKKSIDLSNEFQPNDLALALYYLHTKVLEQTLMQNSSSETFNSILEYFAVPQITIKKIQSGNPNVSLLRRAHPALHNHSLSKTVSDFQIFFDKEETSFHVNKVYLSKLNGFDLDTNQIKLHSIPSNIFEKILWFLYRDPVFSNIPKLLDIPISGRSIAGYRKTYKFFSEKSLKKITPSEFKQLYEVIPQLIPDAKAQNKFLDYIDAIFRASLNKENAVEFLVIMQELGLQKNTDQCARYIAFSIFDLSSPLPNWLDDIITLDLSGVPFKKMIVNDQVIERLQQVVRRSPFIGLNLDDSNITEQQVMNIFRACPNPKNLKLSLRGVKNLGPHVAEMASGKCAGNWFSNCPFTDTQLWFIFNRFYSLPLANLLWKNSQYLLTDTGLETLSKKMAGSLKLHPLKLDLYRNKFITADGFLKFINQTEHKVTALELSDCPNLEQMQIPILNKAIRKLPLTFIAFEDSTAIQESHILQWLRWNPSLRIALTGINFNSHFSPLERKVLCGNYEGMEEQIESGGLLSSLLREILAIRNIEIIDEHLVFRKMDNIKIKKLAKANVLLSDLFLKDSPNLLLLKNSNFPQLKNVLFDKTISAKFAINFLEEHTHLKEIYLDVETFTDKDLKNLKSVLGQSTRLEQLIIKAPIGKEDSIMELFRYSTIGKKLMLISDITENAATYRTVDGTVGCVYGYSFSKLFS